MYSAVDGPETGSGYNKVPNPNNAMFKLMEDDDEPFPVEWNGMVQHNVGRGSEPTSRRMRLSSVSDFIRAYRPAQQEPRTSTPVRHVNNPPQMTDPGNLGNINFQSQGSMNFQPQGNMNFQSQVPIPMEIGNSSRQRDPVQVGVDNLYQGFNNPSFNNLNQGFGNPGFNNLNQGSSNLNQSLSNINQGANSMGQQSNTLPVRFSNINPQLLAAPMGFGQVSQGANNINPQLLAAPMGGNQIGQGFNDLQQRMGRTLDNIMSDDPGVIPRRRRVAGPAVMPQGYGRVQQQVNQFGNLDRQPRAMSSPRYVQEQCVQNNDVTQGVIGNARVDFVDNLEEINYVPKKIYLFANCHMLERNFMTNLIRRDGRGQYVLNPANFQEHAINDHQIRLGIGATGVYCLENLVSREYKNFHPNYTVLIPESYGELAPTETDVQRNDYVHTLKQKCRSIYYTSFPGKECLKIRHHYFIVVTPRPGHGGRANPKDEAKISEILVAARANLHNNNVILVKTEEDNYYSIINKLLAGLVCSACQIDLQSVNVRALKMDSGGCSSAIGTAHNFY